MRVWINGRNDRGWYRTKAVAPVKNTIDAKSVRWSGRNSPAITSAIAEYITKLLRCVRRHSGNEHIEAAKIK